MPKRKSVSEMEPKEMHRARLDDNWVCPICGPVAVAPVDLPTVLDFEGSDNSPPHCITCGTAIQPHLPLVYIGADRFAAQMDHVRRQASAYGVIDLLRDDARSTKNG